MNLTSVPETMAMRAKMLPENGLISQVAMSAMDNWGGEIKEQAVPVLVIIEGLSAARCGIMGILLNRLGHKLRVKPQDKIRYELDKAHRLDIKSSMWALPFYCYSAFMRTLSLVLYL